MPRRRLNWWTGAASGALSAATGMTPTASRLALEIAGHVHKQRTGSHGPPTTPQLVNYKEQGPRRKRSKYRLKKKPKALKGTPVDLSIGGGKLSTKTFLTKNKILTKNKAMPYRRKTYRRRRLGARRFRRRLTKIPLGISRKKLVRFRVVGNDTLTGNGGALATKMIKANSLNAPIGGTGLPATLDQWAAFYEKYTVIGSKLTVTFSNTTNTGPVHVGLHLHKNNTALASHAHYRELPMTRNKFLTTNKDLTSLTMKYSGKKFWHVGSITSDSEQEATLASGVPTDPTDIAYFHIFIQDVVGANNSIVDIQMALELICVLNEPINVARSSV